VKHGGAPNILGCITVQLATLISSMLTVNRYNHLLPQQSKPITGGVPMKLVFLFLALILSLGYSSTVDAQEPTLTEVARLGRGTAQSLSWRPDGEVLAVGSTAGLWLFDAEGEQIAHHPAFPVKNIEFSPDGASLALSDVRGMSEIWLLDADGALVSRSEPLPLGGYNVRWSPDGGHLSSLYQVWENQRFDRMMLGMWDATSGTLVWELSPSDTVLDVIWSTDGQQLAAVDMDGTVVMMDAESGETIKTFNVMENLSIRGSFPTHGVTFTKDGKGLWLLLAGSDRLWIWDLEKSELKETRVEVPFAGYDLSGLELQQGSGFLTTQIFARSIYILSESTEPMSVGLGDSVVDYAWIPGENRLSVLNRSGILSERGLEDDDTSIDRQLFSYSSQREAWSPDSQWLVQMTGTHPYDHSYPILAWDVSQADLTSYDSDRVMYPYVSAKWSQWMPDGQYLMVFSDNTSPEAQCWVYAVEQWDIAVGAVTPYWEDGVCGLQNTPDVENLANFDISVWTWDFSQVAVARGHEIWISSDRPQRESVNILRAEGQLTALYWNLNATYLLSISFDEDRNQSFIEVWDVSTNQRVLSLTESQPVVSAIWSPDARSIAVLTGADTEYTVSVVEVLTSEVRFLLPFQVEPSVHWRPDSAQLAVMYGSEEGSNVDVVNSTTGEYFSLVSTDDEISIGEMTWHPSQSWLTVSVGEVLNLYNVDTQTTNQVVDVYAKPIGWSPDGTMLAVQYRDLTLGIWRLTAD
jgi:WD40 repeat protein